jgi:S1-C subfamily serine protease
VVAAAGILGTVSDAFRTWRGGRVDQYLRPDIALFPGFSGGALLSGEGKALGVNTSAFQRRGGMTMPASTVNRVVGELLEKGHVSRPYLGLAMQPVRLAKTQRDKIKAGSDYGVLVVHVEPDGPADKAGLLVGDLLLQIGDKAVTDTDDVQEILGTLTTGKSVSVGLIRGGAPLSLSITIGERPRR